jgi:SAM-dependent methyltransferase
MELAIDFVHFSNRAARIRYAAQAFASVLDGKVLDVGCDAGTLKQLRPDLDYLGIDIGGRPDLVIDLERTSYLPFADRSFDTVVCSDVLEHLDTLHRTFAELVRVASRYILVSLPNCWCGARRPLRRGKGAIGHYGLPADRPADRHKWFFGLSEGRRFAESAAARHGLRIVEMRVSEKPRLGVVRALRRLRYPSRERYLNLYAHTLWILFAQTTAAPAAVRTASTNDDSEFTQAR